ncbi:MAG TPA: hypothetical protein VEW73_02205 [Nocardioides sp.]|nr:hypothetical protein [Nocardioides sp.]
MPVTIRRAVEADAQTLSRLAALTFPLACTPQTTAETLAAHIAEHLDEASFGRHLADPDRILLVAEDEDGEAVGYTMLVLREGPGWA